MAQVAEELVLRRETLHLAVNYVDRLLSAANYVSKVRYQLVGVAALFIAAKLEEVYPPNPVEVILNIALRF